VLYIKPSKTKCFLSENHLDKSRLNTGDCTAHFIREEVLRKIVLNRIFAVTAMFYEDITAFMELIQEQRFDEAEKDIKRKRRDGLQNLTGFSSGFMRTTSTAQSAMSDF